MLELIVDDLGGVRAAARVCGVHPATVYRWLRMASPVPVAAYRALQAASSWGRSERAVYSANERALHLSIIAQLRADLARLEKENSRLVRLSSFGCANAPLFRAVRA